jgi:hypothetical protein
MNVRRRRRLVRHGHLPEREIMTGIGAVAVHCPRVRDCGGEGSERIRFSSAILPPYARRSKSLEVLIPILYLKGISTGDFEDALIALLGRDAGGAKRCSRAIGFGARCVKRAGGTWERPTAAGRCLCARVRPPAPRSPTGHPRNKQNGSGGVPSVQLSRGPGASSPRRTTSDHEDPLPRLVWPSLLMKQEPFISANFRHGPDVFAGDRGGGIGARRLGCRAPSH